MFSSVFQGSVTLQGASREGPVDQSFSNHVLLMRFKGSVFDLEVFQLSTSTPKSNSSRVTKFE